MGRHDGEHHQESNLRGLHERAGILRVLGDPVRLGVVDLLALSDLSPDILAEHMQIKGNLLAHHLKVLSDAGLITRVESHHDKRRRYVHLQASALTGLLPDPLPIPARRVVFVCTHNSARSVMAEALWTAHSAIPCTSAGTQPAAHYHPRAVDTIERAGLLVPATGPQRIKNVQRPEDTIVTVCDAVHEDLDDLPEDHLHWSIDDPAALDTPEAFQSTFDDLTGRVNRLADVLHTTDAPHGRT